MVKWRRWRGRNSRGERRWERGSVGGLELGSACGGREIVGQRQKGRRMVEVVVHAQGA